MSNACCAVRPTGDAQETPYFAQIPLAINEKKERVMKIGRKKKHTGVSAPWTASRSKLTTMAPLPPPTAARSSDMARNFFANSDSPTRPPSGGIRHAVTWDNQTISVRGSAARKAVYAAEHCDPCAASSVNRAPDSWEKRVDAHQDVHLHWSLRVDDVGDGLLQEVQQHLGTIDCFHLCLWTWVDIRQIK